jgi:hypothetical protein
MYTALRADIARYGAGPAEGRVELFTTAMVAYLETLSKSDLAAWWFVLVFTQAAGAWGIVDGVTYFHQWLGDTQLAVIEEAFTRDARYWTDGEARQCLAELDYAIRYRSAMMAVLLDDRDSISTS